MRTPRSEVFFRAVVIGYDFPCDSSDGLVLPHHFTHSHTYVTLMQSKYWIFTLNNPGVPGTDYLAVTRSWKNISFILFQEERGEHGTTHFQGYCEFSKLQRITSVKKCEPRAHWECRRGTQKQAIDYCSKEETRVSGPYSHGTATETHQGKRSDLTAAVEALRTGGLKRVREEHPETYIKYPRGFRELSNSRVQQDDSAPEVTLLFGPPGSGKTRSYFEAEGSDAGHMLASGGYWFDAYDGDEAFLLDDFDGKFSKWTLAQTLCVTDRYKVRLPVKGGFTVWQPKRIYISTNFHPTDWFDFSGRQQQYPALVRRFTKVIWFREDGTREDIRPSEEERWRYFWRGREGAQQVLDQEETVRTGVIVSRAPTMNYFDF